MLANLLVLIMDFIPGVPLPYRAIFLAPAIELTNIMACSVFRNTKTGYDDKDVQGMSAIMFRKSTNEPVFIHTQTGSVTESEFHGSSVTDTTMPSSDFHTTDKFARPPKEAISEFSMA